MDSKQGELPRKLDPAKAAAMKIEKIPMDKATFDKMHMPPTAWQATNFRKASQSFSKALEELEQHLAQRLSEISQKQDLSRRPLNESGRPISGHP